jgi:cytochrome c biogenesis protein
VTPRDRRLSPPARLGLGLWRLFTSVNFAVLQIMILVIVGLIGMTVTQLPDFAFRTPADYIAQMEIIHAKYDPAMGAGGVAILERLQIFNIFTAWWFSVLLVLLITSIIVCTLNRTPKLWRTCSEIRVVQPDPFYNPILPDRAVVSGIDAGAVRVALRRSHFHVREADVDGVHYVYGDRHRWTKLATLISHLGLILFLVAGAVTSRFGFESGIELTNGESQPVQAIGTPGLLVVKSFGFADPTAPDGAVLDYTTDLAVYQDGNLLARKVIRVNDPLSVDGFTFHQNGFRPAPDIVIRDSKGQPLWTGPVPLDDSVDGSPHGVMSVPGEDNIGLEMLLTKASDGTDGVLFLPYRATGLNPDGTPITQSLTPFFVPVGGVAGSPDTSFYVQLLDIQNATILVAKQDPGQDIVWFAFLSLITGLMITFYLPRRRIWARLDPSGELQIVGRSERYVDFRREFSRLLDDLVAARQPHGALNQPVASVASVG